MSNEHLAHRFCRSFGRVGARGRFSVGYSAHYEWGLSRSAIRTDALLAALLIGTLVAIEYFGKSLRSNGVADAVVKDRLRTVFCTLND
jgi:hypothetical protein